jgi:hypothetical protein
MARTIGWARASTGAEAFAFLSSSSQPWEARSERPEYLIIAVEGLLKLDPLGDIDFKRRRGCLHSLSQTSLLLLVYLDHFNLGDTAMCLSPLSISNDRHYQGYLR